MTPDRWRQVTGVFHDALTRHMADRDAFVDKACGNDLTLRTEVERLLTAHRNAGMFGDTPVSAPAPPIVPGTLVGPYRVVHLLGAGGMGEVYRANDSKLGRDVAIKILPQIFTTDPERRARFDQEARLLASLNHPHIGAVYGVEEFEGIPALVMELVEGEDLAQRIARGPMPVAEALPMAAQLAGALEAAHEQGIIHRDLKPANIKVRDDGTVKVLDFGLAKVLEAVPLEITDAGKSPAVSARATQVGRILGTAAYMSPEQARGKPADRRSDLWAFGVVLCEMLTGRPCYTGETAAEILAAVIERDPDIHLLPATTPPAIRDLLRRCLTKDPRMRLQAIGEARIVIDRAVAASADSTPSASRDAVEEDRGARVTGHARAAWAIAALALAGMAALAIPAMRYLRAGEVTGPEERLQVITPPAGDARSFAISPDGLHLVFSATVAGRTQLWIRPLAAVAAQPLPGTDGGTLPFWRPDSQAMGFFADGKLKWIPASGGTATTLASVIHAQGGSWNRDGEIIFAPHVTDQLWRISSSRGTPPVAVTRLEPLTQSGHWSPWFLPDGRHFLYQATGNAEGSGIYVGSIDSSDTKRLTGADGAAVYASPGFLLFARRGSLFAQRFDLDALALAGDTFVVAETPSYSGGAFSASLASGALVYRDGSGTALELAWVDRSGKRISLVSESHTSLPYGLDLSSDNTRIAVDRDGADGNRDIFLLEAARFGVTRLTDNAAGDFYPVWSPDGRQVAFSSNRRAGVMELWARAASGAGEDTLLVASPRELLTPKDWSPDGRSLLYVRVDLKTGPDLWVLPMSGAGNGQPFVVANTAFAERDGQFSLDGKWIAYGADRLGHSEIYVQPFPGPGAVTPVSTSGGTQPRWRKDGTELFYIGLDGWMTAVPMGLGADGQSLRVGAPVRLFPSRMAHRGIAQTHLHAVANGGQRFLIEQAADGGTAALTVVRNWRAAKR
jgi:Tol biopolymer transport system component